MGNGKKRTRRKLLTFLRVIRYGTDSFLRNSWLSIAATAVMTITLLIIFTTFVAQNILTDTLGDLRDKVEMSIYLKTDTADKTGNELVASIKKLSSVRKATFVSTADVRASIIERYKNDNKVLEAIKEATNKNPATIHVVVNDISDTTQLQDYVKNNTELKKYLNPDLKPSFEGERRSTIQSIGRAVSFAQKIGIIAGSVFVIISSLIIFNTIRMAIFNRKEEIQMMKLIGANQSFIRGPFLVESIVYGFIAAIVATGLGVWGLYGVSKTLMSYQISIQPTINMVQSYIFLVGLCMVGVGALIGVVSSLLATHRYLKL